jgi:hypothetical protein
MRSKTPPLSAASPPPHRLPDPIKFILASASLHRTRCSPPSLFSASLVARHRAPPPLSPPLHRQPHPAIASVTKARGKDGNIPSFFFCSRGELRALASSTSPHSGEAPVAFCPRVHRGPKRRLVYGLWTQSTGFSC